MTSQNEKTTLLGKTKQDYASILRWLSYANSELLMRFGGWYRPLMGKDPYNKKNVEETSKAALKNIGVLEKHLTANTFLVGERITLADFFTAAILTRAFATVLDKNWRSNNPAVTRWFTTVINQPPFKAVVENPVLIEQAIQYTPPKKEEKPKKEQPKEEKPAEPKPEKPKHPLEALGKPKLALDEWKRFYSNEDTRSTAMPWFWEHFDPEEWSLWRVQFKYNNELKLTFMANNLIGTPPGPSIPHESPQFLTQCLGGFHARLEASRRYIFGAHAVYGVNYDCLTRGVYMVRGQEHLPAFDVAPDWESYDFTKLDPVKDRKEIEDMWAWDTNVVIDGKEYPWVDGHVFK